MRALACLNILLFHAYGNLSTDIGPGLARDIQGYLSKGAVGVAVFFVLSGMLVSYKFWWAYFTKSPFPSVSAYAWRRASRILPAFYVCLAVSFFVTMMINKTDHGWSVAPALRVFSAMTLTSSFHYVTYFPTDQNIPLWAVPMEAVSYVILPVLMLGLFAIKRRGRAIGAAYWLGAIALAAAVHEWVIRTFPMEPDHYNWVTDIARSQMPGRNPAGFFGQFAIGVAASAFIVLWKIHRGGRRTWVFDGIALAATATIVAYFWAVRDDANSVNELTLQQQPYHYPYFAILVAVLAVSLGFSKTLWRAFDNPFLRVTAKYSYGIYLWHTLIYLWMGRHVVSGYYWGGMTDPWLHAATTLVAVVITYGVAMLSYRFVERPFLEGSFAAKPPAAKPKEPAPTT